MFQEEVHTGSQSSTTHLCCQSIPALFSVGLGHSFVNHARCNAFQKTHLSRVSEKFQGSLHVTASGSSMTASGRDCNVSLRISRLFANFVYFFSFSLLKTFSRYPFQGQYPNRAVAINIAPINPTTQRKIPSMEKAKIIKMAPMIERKIASILPTFFVLTMGSIFFSSWITWSGN